MKKIKLLSYIIILCMLVFAGVNAETILVTDKASKDNSEVFSPKKAPNFKLKNIDGKKVRLSDYKGKIVVLDFWATWCAPCRNSIPDLVALQNDFKDKVVVLGVSMDSFSGTVDDIKPAIKELKINYPVILANEKIYKDYGNIDNIPTSFIIDQDGKIISKYMGITSKDIYANQIKALLK